MARMNHRNRTGKPSPRLHKKAQAGLERAEQKKNADIPSLGFQADKKGLKNLSYLKTKGIITN